jgi:hypothetical protein
LADEDNLLLVDTDGRKAVTRKVLYKSTQTDLCIVQALDGVTGLRMAEDTNVGDQVYAVGHPALMPQR